MFIYLLNFFLLAISVILTIAFFTLLERKTMASIQRRRGPNIAGLFGIFQPIADALKLLMKELILPSSANLFLFLGAPLFTFFCTLLIWFTIPVQSGHVSIVFPLSTLLILSISSLSVHGIIFSGWSSNSKYAFLGGIRSGSQMISYELSMGAIFSAVILLSGSFSLTDIVHMQEHVWFVFPLLPFWILFLIISLAETNRTPFDLPEAEAELVAGYNVEYSAIAFALFFLAEYGNMIIMSSLAVLFFWGGWTFFNVSSVLVFSIKVCIHMFFFLWVRAALPRYRYDQLMKLGWKALIPISFTLILIEAGIIVGFDSFF
jgi:NADH:ubiquinone oxidoreductase subunit H